MKTKNSIYDFTVRDSSGNIVKLDKYKNKVLLIVNTATHCGFTPQYEGLEGLYKAFKQKGFEILDFPCNQFANQAPESNEEIAGFCKLNYGTTFTTFAKIEVNGRNTHPLYKYLKKQKGGPFGGRIKWNFTKFLVSSDGKVIKRFAPATQPAQIASYIDKELKNTGN